MSGVVHNLQSELKFKDADFFEVDFENRKVHWTGPPQCEMDMDYLMILRELDRVWIGEDYERRLRLAYTEIMNDRL